MDENQVGLGRMAPPPDSHPDAYQQGFERLVLEMFRGRDERFNTYREYREREFDLYKRATDLHLAELNHEAEQLKLMQATYLPREVYLADNARREADQRETMRIREARDYDDRRSRTTNHQAMILGVIAMVLSIMIPIALYIFRTPSVMPVTQYVPAQTAPNK